jgi:tetratricopeptide (TPR) repeat protein
MQQAQSQDRKSVAAPGSPHQAPAPDRADDSRKGVAPVAARSRAKRATKTYCNYHATTPAQWDCPRCATNYCAACITRRSIERYGRKETLYFCPKCNDEAQRLAVSNLVVPFWNRLPQFFLYPLRPRPLIVMIALSAASVLFAAPGIFNALMQIAIGGVLLKYSHAALRKTAQGSFTPPPINAETISDDFQIVFKQFAIFGIVGFVTALAIGLAGPWVGIPCLIVAVLAVPAMIIVLVATKSLLNALNPVVWGSVAWRIGWGYLIMYLFLAFLAVAPGFLTRYLIAYLPAASHVFLFNLARCFYTVISYHLMGYVLLQYHEEVGYEVETDEKDSFLSQDAVADEAGSALLTRVDIFIKEGKIDDAIALIKGETSGGISNLDLAERYFNLLKIKQLVPDMLKHARRYLELLAEAKEKTRLREVYSACVAADPGFTPGAAAVFKIAGCFNDAGNPKDAIQVYNRFIKAYPKDPTIPKACFLAASIINEKLKNPGRAVGLLKNVLRAYPNHDLVPHIQKYLKQVEVAG